MGFFDKKALIKALSKETKAKKHKILVVDDETHNRATLEDLLSPEYNVITASNGEEGLERIRSEKDPNDIHLIISDQRMPRLTGVEFLHKTIEIIPKTKKILLTAFTDVDAIIDSINKGQIYKFILKPFEHQDMLTTVRRALEAYDMEQRNAELVEELREMNVTLEQKVEDRTQELKRARDDLEMLNASKDKFFSIIAHDIRNPLHGFLLSSEAIVHYIDLFEKEKIVEIAQNMNNMASKLHRLLENLLDWSRLQMGQMNQRPALIDLHELGEDVVELLIENASLKRIALEQGIPKETFAYADKNMIRTVMRNLISNAIKFTPQDGRISVSSNLQNGHIEFAISDTGVGIPEEHIEKLFRIDSHHTTKGTTGEKGNGLGLILCKEFTEKNQGTLEITSEVGKGSTFTVRLPIRPKEEKHTV